MNSNERVGRYIALSLPAIDFASYEIWNFIEQNTKVTIEDLSVFRNVSGEPTGVVVAVLQDDISLSRLSRLADKKFKDVSVESRLFTTPADFHKFMRVHADTGLENTHTLHYQNGTIVLYVLGFGGNQTELKELLGRCGTINVIDFSPKGKFFTVYFASSESAKIASSTFDGVDGMSVVKLYQRAAEESFIVRGCDNPDLVASELRCFGRVADMRIGEDEIGVVMETRDAAKAACTLLKCIIPGVYTYFVDKFYIEQM